MTENVSKSESNQSSLSSNITTNSAASLEKPLLGAVVCCTAIAPEDRTRIAEHAEQMGAEHKLDLTSDVTHLLVGSTDTPKYQYVAREREDVKVLQPQWVEAVRQCWMEDLPLDMNALEAKYRVPTLAGLKICITGFDDLSFRGQLQKNVVSNGGEYTGDLTKEVTHLIAAKAEGKKYEYATLWQKKVVSLQWYKDTLDRGMQLDETKYHPSRPPEEQGIGAWNRQEKQQTTTGKRTREETLAQEPARKLRRVTSARLGSQSDFMWGDIVGQASQGPATKQANLRSMKSMPDLGENRRPPQEEQNSNHNVTSAGRFLTGLPFAVVNFEGRKKALLLQTLQAAGATIYGSAIDMLDHNEATSHPMYLIVPYQTRQSEISYPRGSTAAPSIVTELWLERCIQQKDLVPPIQYPLGGLIREISSPDIELFTVNATGFQPIETLHISKTVNMTGAKYAETFTPQSSVLVCNSLNINKQKVFHARQWGVPAVSENWLCRFLTDGSIPGFENYLIESNDVQDNKLEAELEQRRNGRHRRQSPDTNGGRNGSQKQSIPGAFESKEPAASANTGTVGRSQQEQNRTEHQGRSQGDRHRSSGLTEDPALLEISPNSPLRSTKPMSSPKKKTLFRNYSGTVTGRENNPQQPRLQPPNDHLSLASPNNFHQDTASINSAIEDLLSMKAKARASISAQHSQEKSKKLLNRALSNLSNASHGSRKSRASSIDSLNTDGIGSEIVPPRSRSNTMDNLKGPRRSSMQSQIHGKTSPVAQVQPPYQTTAIDMSDMHLLNHEFEAEEDRPQMTQLGYEDSEEAIALREKLAAKRRARAKLGQRPGDPSPEIDGKEREAMKLKQKQVIKDDESLTASGWGGGRRTRAKNRSVEMKDLEMF